MRKVIVKIPPCECGRRLRLEPNTWRDECQLCCRECGVVGVIEIDAEGTEEPATPWHEVIR